MYRYLIIFLLTFVSLNQSAAQHEDIRREIDKIIQYDTAINYRDTPGFLVGIIDGSERYYLNFAEGSNATIAAQDEKSLFEIGSCTKLFTAAIVEDLVLRDLLSYDDLVNSFFAQKYYNPKLADLSIADLIYHKTPFPKRPIFFGKKEKDPMNPYAYFNRHDLLVFYHQFTPREEANSQYSHCNYALLEVILEAATHKDYSSLLDSYTTKWGLEQTQVEEVDTLSPGYDRAGRVTQRRTYASFAGSEGIKSTLADLSDYLALHWANDPKIKAIANTLKVHGPSRFDPDIRMAKGWHAIDKNGAPHIYMQTGTTSGHKAYMSMVPSTQTAVVILANSSIGTQDLAVLILRMINEGWERKSP